MAKKNLLKDIAMPELKEDELLEMDDELLADEEAEDFEGEEMPEELGILEDISDEELLAELKKRGLSPEADEEEEVAEEDDEELDMEML